jgi:hypothetical protein
VPDPHEDDWVPDYPDPPRGRTSGATAESTEPAEDAKAPAAPPPRPGSTAPGETLE